MRVMLVGGLRNLRNAVWGAAFAIVSVAAQANLIVNGDFESGNLTGWTTFATSAGTIGTPAVVSFDTTGSGASNSAQFLVGRLTGTGTPEGGGIYQTFAFGGGSILLRADIAARDPNASGNSSGGIFELLVDGIVLDTFDFGSIAGNSTERGSLDYAGSLGAGSHELRVRMTRGFTIEEGATPYQYIDNVTAIASIPEPGTLALLGLGLAGLAATRRRRQ